MLEALLDLLSDVTASPDVIVGNGDDGAAWHPPDGAWVVTSTDAIVEGMDFRRDWIGPFGVGSRAVEVALSDLAGMGARPHHCLITVCAAGADRLDDLLAIGAGAATAASRHGCAILGGDLSAIDGPLVISTTAIGTCRAAMLRRDTGKSGDLLVVTGSLGSAGAGLRALLDDDDSPRTLAWRRAQLAPVARIQEGLAMVERGVGCGGDISDGLLVDAERTAAASRCGAELWADGLPVDPLLRSTDPQWLDLALGAGEDFELLVAVDPARIDALLDGWPSHLAPLTIVGRLTPGSGLVIRSSRDGSLVERPEVRSRHFAITR